MKKANDPSKLFDQLKRIKNKYAHAGMTVKDEDLIAVVLSAAPKEYQAVLLAEQ